MNHFLIYWDEHALQDTRAIGAALGELNQISTFRPADFNVHLCSTEKDGAAIFAILSRHLPRDSNFLIATIEEIGFRGNGQFGSTLTLLSEQASAPAS